MFQRIIRSILDNVVVRALLRPLVVAVRSIEHARYLKEDDSKYIRRLRNKYKDKRCFIIGNGPSLTASDLDMLKDEITFACNRIYDIFPYTCWKPSYYMCIDSSLINEMMFNQAGILRLSQSEVYCVNRKFVRSLKEKINIHEIFLDGKFLVNINKLVMKDISEDVHDHFTKTLSVTCTMLEFAFYMGFKEIYLLGIDHNFGIEINMNGDKVVNTNVQAHFKEQNNKSVFPARKEALTKSYETMKEYADAHGISIKNATRGGKLEVFERVDFDSLFA